MSRDYEAKNPDVESFNVNVSGSDLLGAVCAVGGCRTHFRRVVDSIDLAPLWVAEEFDVSVMVSALKRTPDEEFLRVLDENDPEANLYYRGYCWAGTKDEFLGWVKEWISWLEKCGGYEVPM